MVIDVAAAPSMAGVAAATVTMALLLMTRGPPMALPAEVVSVRPPALT